MDETDSKAQSSFTTRRVWKKKKNGLYGWGVRRQRILNGSELNMESTEASMISNTSFSIDYAKRKSVCRNCKQPIERGELRMGNMKNYRHPTCMFKAFPNMTNSAQIFKDPNDFDGWFDIQKEDMATILNLMKREITIKEEPIDILSSQQEFEQNLMNQCSIVEKLRLEPEFDDTSMNQSLINEKLRMEPGLYDTLMNNSSTAGKLRKGATFDETSINQSSIAEELRIEPEFDKTSINISSINEKLIIELELRIEPEFDKTSTNLSSINEKLIIELGFDDTSMNQSSLAEKLIMDKLSVVEDISTQGEFVLNEVEGNFFLTQNSKHVSYCINRIFALNRQRRSNTDKLEDIVSITGEIEALKDKERHIYNLKAQDNCTADIAYKSMKSSLEAMKTHATAHGVTHSCFEQAKKVKYRQTGRYRVK